MFAVKETVTAELIIRKSFSDWSIPGKPGGGDHRREWKSNDFIWSQNRKKCI